MTNAKNVRQNPVQNIGASRGRTTSHARTPTSIAIAKNAATHSPVVSQLIGTSCELGQLRDSLRMWNAPQAKRAANVIATG